MHIAFVHAPVAQKSFAQQGWPLPPHPTQLPFRHAAWSPVQIAPRQQAWPIAPQSPQAPLAMHIRLPFIPAQFIPTATQVSAPPWSAGTQQPASHWLPPQQG